MASILSHLQAGCRPGLARISCRRVCAARHIHQTPIALKKQKANIPEDGDLFGDFGAGESSEDLFSASKDAVEVVGAAPSVVPVDAVKLAAKADAQERVRRFNDKLQFVGLRIGRDRKEKLPHIRNGAWQELFQLATTRQQMEAVVNLFPKWRDTKPRRVFNVQNTELFTRRCDELKCPDLALKVFADHSKYGLDLNSVHAARRLLRSLHEESLEDTMTVAALFGVYKLPPISSDLISCAMFTAACLKQHTTQSLVIAREMVPQLKELLTKTSPKAMELPTTGPGWVKVEAKEKGWAARSLAVIEQALTKEEGDYSWLSKWRQDSGHAQVVSL